MMFKYCFLVLSASLSMSMTASLQFSRENMGSNNFAEEVLSFHSRLYVPYGPDLVAGTPVDSQPWAGFGYGMGATEHVAYDYIEGFIYSQSEAGGYVTVIDYSSPPGVISEYSFAIPGAATTDIKDIVVCPEEGFLFLTAEDQTKVFIYNTVKRSSPAVPDVAFEVSVGNAPDAMKLSNDCKTLAVANQDSGRALLSEGALSLITNYIGGGTPTVKRVDLSEFEDNYLLERDVHMPLTKNSMEYWAKANGYDWLVPNSLGVSLLDQYSPALAMDPEFIAFSNDGREIFLNLQKNSALVRIDAATGTALSVDGYGLKEFPDGIDIVDDGECILVTNDCLAFGRTPDGIATVEYEGINYILTGEEGSDYDFDDYEEKYDTADVFRFNPQDGSSVFPFENFTFPENFFDPTDSRAGCTAYFNNRCEANGLAWCSNLEASLGSLAVDYSNKESPKFKKIVGFGGRGIGIYRLSESPFDRMTFVWDSGSAFEQETCDKFPWAHNSVMDEDFAPLDGALYQLSGSGDKRDIEDRNDPNKDGCLRPDGSFGACPLSQTVDDKAQEDGLAVESVTVGVACDRLFAMGCGENNGMCLLYDITIIESPVLKKTFNLSPVNENKNPQESYRVDMGDLDSETVIFVPHDRSPTGKSALIFGGAISGTLSYYEFECLTPESTGNIRGAANGAIAEVGLTSGAIAGIVIASIVALGVVVFVAKKRTGGQKEYDNGQ